MTAFAAYIGGIMRSKITSRAFTIAAQRKAQGPRSKKGELFTGGLLLGLGSASLFLAGTLPAPKVPPEGQNSDWEAVGRDMRSAIRGYSER